MTIQTQSPCHTLIDSCNCVRHNVLIWYPGIHTFMTVLRLQRRREGKRECGGGCSATRTFQTTGVGFSVFLINELIKKSRKSPSSDRRRPRPNVPACEGLPHQRRLRIKKRAKTQNLHVRFMTANIGSMTGKSMEIADIMHRRKIMIACVQETKWKGSKAKEIGEGFKLYYHGICRARNGIGIILSKEWQYKILDIKRISDRIMTMKLVSGNNT